MVYHWKKFTCNFYVKYKHGRYNGALLTMLKINDVYQNECITLGEYKFIEPAHDEVEFLEENSNKGSIENTNLLDTINIKERLDKDTLLYLAGYVAHRHIV